MHAWDCRCGTRNAPTFPACRKCGGPAGAGRVVPDRPVNLPPAVSKWAARPPQWGPRPARPVAGPATADPNAEGINWAGLWWVAVAILGVLGWGLPRWLGGQSSHYEIRVHTEPAMAFSGNYGGITGDGSSSSLSVDGFGDAAYDAGTQSITEAVFQKKSTEGIMTVEIWRDGSPYRSETTSAAYGCVSIGGS